MNWKRKDTKTDCNQKTPVAVAKRQKNVILWLSFDHFENKIGRIDLHMITSLVREM